MHRSHYPSDTDTRRCEREGSISMYIDMLSEGGEVTTGEESEPGEKVKLGQAVQDELAGSAE